MTDEHGVPDAENPELTEEDFARARRWQPGDPLNPGEAKVLLRKAALRLVDAMDEIGRDALPPAVAEEIDLLRAALAWENACYSAA